MHKDAEQSHSNAQHLRAKWQNLKQFLWSNGVVGQSGTQGPAPTNTGVLSSKESLYSI